MNAFRRRMGVLLLGALGCWGGIVLSKSDAAPVLLAAGFDYNNFAKQLFSQAIQQIQKQQTAQNQSQPPPTKSNNSPTASQTVNGVPTVDGTGGTIRILSGTGSFASVSDASDTLTISPGTPLNGMITLSVLNLGPRGAVAPLIYTPSWGVHSNSWRQVSGWVPTGQSQQKAQVSLTAPTTPGTYHIIFAVCWEVGGDHVASATSWGIGKDLGYGWVNHYDVWNDGNDIADFNAAQISSAQQNGWAMNNDMNGPDSSHSTRWYSQRPYPADAITLVVSTSTSGGSANLVPNSFCKFLASQAGKAPPDFSPLVDVDLANSIWRDGVTIAATVRDPAIIKNQSAGVQLLWKYMVMPADGPMFKVMTGSDPTIDEVVTAFACVGSFDAVTPPTTEEEILALVNGGLSLASWGMADYFGPIINDVGTLKLAGGMLSLGNQIKTFQDARKKGCLIGGGVGIIAFDQYAKADKSVLATLVSRTPKIISVGAILPQQIQTVTISGSGFGTQNAVNGTSKFLKIHDDTANWDAGFSGDWINLNVSQWTDSRIVIKGFTGAYGLGGWKLNAGDKLTISVWNAQSGNGPATFNTTVSSN